MGSHLGATAEPVEALAAAHVHVRAERLRPPKECALSQRHRTRYDYSLCGLLHPAPPLILARPSCPAEAL
eukprot:2063571-Prymnesium_polylepis.1